MKIYGWEDYTLSLCNGDLTKYDSICRMNVMFVLYILSMNKSKNEIEAKLAKG